MKNMKKIIAITIILSMLFNSIAFAFEVPVYQGAKKMLAPVLHIDAALFQQGYNQAQNLIITKENIKDKDNLISQIIESSAGLQNNKIIDDFFGKFKIAYQDFLEGARYAALYEGAMQAPNYNPKILQNKEVMSLTGAALSFWEKSLRVLEKIDIEQVKQSLGREHNQIAYFYYTLKAQVAFALAEKDPKLSDAQRYKHYQIAVDSLDAAFKLNDVQADFDSLIRMATAVAKVATSTKLTIDQKIELAKESVAYFEIAKEQIPNLSQTDSFKKKIRDLNYTFFTTLYFMGDLYKTKHDYKQAILFYDKVVSLTDNFPDESYVEKSLKGFYLDYYRMLWAFSDNFYEKVEDTSEVRRDGIVTFYSKTDKLAHAFIDLLSESDKNQEAHLDAYACIVEVRLKLAEQSMKDNDWQQVKQHLAEAHRALQELDEINSQDQYSNFLIAKQHTLIAKAVIDILKDHVAENGATNSQLNKISHLIDKGYFREFRAKIKQDDYTKLIEKLKDKNDIDNEAELMRKIFVDSDADGKIRFYLEKALRVGGFDKVKKAKFNKSYGYISKITLAMLNLNRSNYAQAKKMIVEAAKHPEKMAESPKIVEGIVQQAALDGKEGKVFMTDLLMTRSISAKIIANIIKYKDSITPRSRIMLKTIFMDKENQRLAKDNPGILKVLGIEIKDPGKEKQQNKNNVQPVSTQITKTPEVLISKVQSAIRSVQEQINIKPKRQKKKGKKKASKQKPLAINSPQINQLRNALTALADAYEQRKSAMTIDYLKALVLKEEVFKNPLAMKTLAQVVSNMEKEKALEILGIYKGFFGENEPAAAEAIQAYEHVIKCHRNIEEFIEQAKAIRSKISKIDISGLKRPEADDALDKIEREFENLIDQFEHIQKVAKGSEVFRKYRRSISDRIDNARQEVKAEFEKNKTGFIDACKSCEDEIDLQWDKIINQDKSDIEKIIALKSWKKSQGMPIADKDVLSDADAKQAQDALKSLWQEKQQTIDEFAAGHSLICKNKVRFNINDDLDSVHFDNIDILIGIGDEHAVKDMFLVMKALYSFNPELDVEKGITGKEHPNSEDLFMPRFEKAKDQIREVKKALKLAHKYDKFAAKYEQLMELLLKSEATPVLLIRKVRDLLAGEFEDGLTDDLAEDPEGIMEKALDDFAIRSNKIFDKQEAVETIADGQLRLQVEGDYKYLVFLPLSQNIDIAKVEDEIRAIWAEALSYNLEIRMKVGKETDPEEEWVIDIADLWDREYDIANKDKQKQQIVEKPKTEKKQDMIKVFMQIGQSI
jgi:hypothetical protein